MENTQALKNAINKRYSESGLGDPPGLKKLNQGHNRIVYIIVDETYGQDVEGNVLKVSLPSSIENEQEVEAWKKYEDTEYGKYLVPIIEYADDYTWVVMPYGESVPSGLVDQELIECLRDIGGSDISDDDFIYMNGNFSNQRCCDYATLINNFH